MKKNLADTSWKNRIVGYSEEQPDQLLASPMNWRIHPKNQQEALSGVLGQVGVVQNIICNRATGHVIDGHLRVALAMRSGQPTIPVTWVDLTPEEEALILTTLDPLAAMAATDKAKLDELMHAVQSDDERVQQMLADMAEREGLEYGKQEPSDDPGAQVDRAEELREKWQTAPGQLWRLGEHRLICGDCTDRAVVERLMQGEKADAIITDPPYNVDKAEWDTNILPLLKSAADLLPEIITDKGICFWFTATRYIPEVINATAALPYRWMFIWYPSNNMAHGDLGFQKFTAALVLGKDKIWRENMQDLREFPIKITKEDPGHPTPKPIDLIEYLVEMASREIVYDGFLGSGTTLIACERLGRKCRAAEISPAYVSVALERFYQMTNVLPLLISSEGISKGDSLA